MSSEKPVLFPHNTSIDKHINTTLIETRKEAFDYPFLNEAIARLRKPDDRQGELRPDSLSDSDKLMKIKGFIFHPSHCGSTLLARMMTALPRTRVLSEPEAINSLLLAYWYHDLPRARVLEQLKAIIECFRQPLDGEENLVIKPTSWNVFLVNLFLEIYPDVPWIYLDRDTESAVDSSLRDGGGWVQWIDFPTDLPRKYLLKPGARPTNKEDYVRQVIIGQRERASAFFSELSRAFHYPAFIDQFETDILPHFDLNFTQEEINIARQMTQYQSKSYDKVAFDKVLTS